MDHKPYESWLVADEALLPDQEISLQEHLETCETCRQLQKSWQEVEDIFEERILLRPNSGFTERWQLRLAKEFSLQSEKEQLRSTWMFLAATTGTAFLVLVIMSIRFFSTMQNPTEAFISGMTLVAGVLNLTETIQKAIFPLFEVFILSVPTLWWLFLILSAILLTLVLTFSILRVLRTRRVSL
jgi:hypothetical protein